MTVAVVLLALLVGILVPSAYKKRYNTIYNTNQGVNVIDDFLEASGNSSDALAYYGTVFKTLRTGTGQVKAEFATDPFNYPGEVACFIAATNDTTLLSSNWSFKGSAVFDTQTRFFFDTLGNGSDGYDQQFGYSDNFASRSSAAQAALIFYNQSVSNNYVCFVKSPAGGTSQIVTSVPATANADTYFRIVVTPNICYFYINALLVATINNSPTNANTGSLAWCRVKSSGTNGSSLYVDAISVSQSFANPRRFLGVQ